MHLPWVYVHCAICETQSSTDALNTATPNLAAVADTAQCTYVHDRYRYRIDTLGKLMGCNSSMDLQSIDRGGVMV